MHGWRLSTSRAQGHDGCRDCSLFWEQGQRAAGGLPVPPAELRVCLFPPFAPPRRAPPPQARTGGRWRGGAWASWSARWETASCRRWAACVCSACEAPLCTVLARSRGPPSGASGSRRLCSCTAPRWRRPAPPAAWPPRLVLRTAPVTAPRVLPPTPLHRRSSPSFGTAWPAQRPPPARWAHLPPPLPAAAACGRAALRGAAASGSVGARAQGRPELPAAPAHRPACHPSRAWCCLSPLVTHVAWPFPLADTRRQSTSASPAMLVSCVTSSHRACATG